MKFTCEREVILKEISIAQDIISSRNALSILSNVLLIAEGDSLLIKATDLKVSFESKIAVDVADEGTTTLFCDKLLGILRSLPPGDIEFESSENEQFVISPVFKSIDFRIKSISAEKYPEIQTAPEESYFSISQTELIEMIGQTVFAVSDDETRYFMNGVFLEKNDQELIMVATDGRRLSYISKKLDNIPEFAGVIIPPKILNLVMKLASREGNLQIAITDKHVFIEFDQQKLSSALIEGQFPNYRRVIPDQQEQSFKVNRNELLDALKRVSLMVEKSRRIYMKIADQSLTLNSEESEIGVAREELPCSFSGPETTIALNFQYLSDPLRVIEGDEVQVEFSEVNRAISILPIPEKDYFHIVMPMQLD
jgi:DNA polymerase-3 subunit beta